jgi:hypothetical protein
VALRLFEASHTVPRNILDSRRHYPFAEELRSEHSLHVCNFNATVTVMRRSTIIKGDPEPGRCGTRNCAAGPRFGNGEARVKAQR